MGQFPQTGFNTPNDSHLYIAFDTDRLLFLEQALGQVDSQEVPEIGPYRGWIIPLEFPRQI